MLWLKQYQTTDIAINLSYLPQQIMSYFGEGSRWGARITYSSEDPVVGTAGAIRKLKTFLQNDTFAVIYGDVLSNIDFSRLQEFHSARRCRGVTATISLYRVSNPTECGIVDLDEDNRVTRILEKPSPNEVFTNLASAGIMIFEPHVIDLIPDEQYVDIGSDLLPSLLREGMPVYGLPISTEEYVIDIGSPERYLQACQRHRAICELTSTQPR